MSSISVVITTFEEEVNIVRAVQSARRFTDDVLVVDSGSTDRTVALAREHGARIMTRPFDDMALQRNAALEKGELRGDYVFFMDADEMISEAFASALESLLESDPEIDGVRICRKFYWWGRWVPAASAFPHFIDRVVRSHHVTFRKEGHGEVFVGGQKFVSLDEPLHDEDLKPIHYWLERHNRYAEMEAIGDLRTRRGETPPSRTRRIRTQLRRVPGWPLVAWGYYMIVRRGVLEGPTGWTYCTMKAMFEYFIQLHTRDRIRRGK